MPAQALGTNQVSESLGSGVTRNYSYLYDKTLYASLWVAYPLTRSHTVGTVTSHGWHYNPSTNIPHETQINVTSASYQTNYNASAYARGHQCPNASRKFTDDVNRETYYVTNQTPQLQNKFNGSIWKNLEDAVRTLTSSTDTVYVITGPSYRKNGGSETIKYLTASGESIKPSQVPIPNYYWKVLLKVKRNSSKDITSASAIGFWFVHKEYESGDDFSNYVVSVDTIEQYTGFDLFANLPDTIESAAEANTSWTSFQNF